MNIKKCTHCLKYLPFSSFSHHPRNKHNLQSRCKQCTILSSKEYRSKNKDKVNAYKKQYREKNKKPTAEYQKEYRKSFKQKYPLRHVYSQLKHRYKKNWDKSIMSLQDFIKFRNTNQTCSYCPNSLPERGCGMDRLDNSKGYILDNVVPCCSSCNRIKGNNLSYVEMKAAMTAVTALRHGAKNVS